MANDDAWGVGVEMRAVCRVHRDIEALPVPPILPIFGRAFIAGREGVMLAPYGDDMNVNAVRAGLYCVLQ